MSNWNSLNDSLPLNDNCYVLVACDGGHVDISFFSRNRDFLSYYGLCYARKRQGKNSGFFSISHQLGYTITHWQNLPEHPTAIAA